jgi:hypothetical protein
MYVSEHELGYATAHAPKLWASHQGGGGSVFGPRKSCKICGEKNDIGTGSLRVLSFCQFSFRQPLREYCHPALCSLDTESVIELLTKKLNSVV